MVSAQLKPPDLTERSNGTIVNPRYSTPGFDKYPVLPNNYQMFQ